MRDATTRMCSGTDGFLGWQRSPGHSVSNAEPGIVFTLDRSRLMGEASLLSCLLVRVFIESVFIQILF